MDDVSVVILAAGLGTRMRSRKAKVLHSAGGRTLVEHAVHTALQLAPAQRTFVVVGHQAEQVRAQVSAAGINFIHQQEQKGTGHAILCGREELLNLGGLLIVYYGDCPLILPGTLEQLVSHQRQHQGGCTMLTTKLTDPTGYGRVIRTETGEVECIVEQKSANREQLAVKEINAGVYCFDARWFWDHIEKMGCDNAAGEYYLTDMIAILIREGHPVHALKVKDSAELLGINNRVELALVDQTFRSRKIHQLMLSGVTVEKPETVTVDHDVTVGMDTVIEPFVQLRGKTVVGENCTIGACSVIVDSELDDDVHVQAFTMIGTSTLKRGVHAGPYTRLRMGNHLEEDVHVGNFVELKKTHVGKRSKAMHLAYLGDAEIGANVNIGAGTITCNYDGLNKHGTSIADGSFIGSNSTLVAPISIGEQAYVAAGSVLTHDVPGQALALGRSRQVNKEGYAGKLGKRKPTA